MTGNETISGPVPVVRIGIQSADRLRREALAAHLETLPAFTVVGRVANYEEVPSLCALQRPAIMLLDAGRDVPTAAAACRLLRERCPDVCLTLTYERLSPADLAGLRETGVDAVVPYSHGLDAVVEVLERLAHGTPRPPATTGLSGRQREILLLLASGHSAIEIGALLGISPGTVENHKRRVYAKLSATSAVQAIAQAAAFGIIDGQPDSAAPNGVAAAAPRVGPRGGYPTERGRQVLALAVGDRREVLDRVVATLIAHRLPVVREHGPSWTEPAHGVRWHRGPVVRILVDPTPDHWRVGAVSGRSTVVVHSGAMDPDVAMAALGNGSAAVLPADQLEDRLVPIMMVAAYGYLVVDRRFSHHVIAPHAIQHTERALLRPTLTGREYDILQSIGRSHTIRQTARSLGIAVKTVENTQGHLFRKLGVHNRAEALAAAYSLGLLHPRSPATTKFSYGGRESYVDGCR